MTKLLEHAIARAKALPAARQDDIGALIISAVEYDESTIRLTAAQVDEVLRRLKDHRPPLSEEEAEELFQGSA
jgi:hypothetical protein